MFYKEDINSSHLLHPPFFPNVLKYNLLRIVEILDSLQQIKFEILFGSKFNLISMDTRYSIMLSLHKLFNLFVKLSYSRFISFSMFAQSLLEGCISDVLSDIL